MIIFEHVAEGQKSWKEGPKSRYKMHKSNKKYEHLNIEMSFFKKHCKFYTKLCKIQKWYWSKSGVVLQLRLAAAIYFVQNISSKFTQLSI